VHRLRVAAIPFPLSYLVSRIFERMLDAIHLIPEGVRRVQQRRRVRQDDGEVTIVER
jgi:hypothetical protein